MTEYKVRALMATRGPSAKQMRSHAKRNQYVFSRNIECTLTFKREVCEQSYILITLPTLRKGSKDKESPPAPAVGAHAYTLYPDSKWVEVTSSNYAALHSSHCLHPSIHQEDPTQDDASRKDPPRDVEGYGRFYLTRPAVENKQIRACEQVDCIYCDADDEEEVENAVG